MDLDPRFKPEPFIHAFCYAPDVKAVVVSVTGPSSSLPHHYTMLARAVHLKFRRIREPSGDALSVYRRTAFLYEPLTHGFKSPIFSLTLRCAGDLLVPCYMWGHPTPWTCGPDARAL